MIRHSNADSIPLFNLLRIFSFILILVNPSGYVYHSNKVHLCLSLFRFSNMLLLCTIIIQNIIRKQHLIVCDVPF